MTDALHTFGGDLSVAASGDLATASGTVATQQRVTRRLLTNQGGYIWQPDYGGGLPGMVGQVASVDAIGAVVREQMALEPTVAATPEPSVSVATNATGQTSAVITYTDAATGAAVTI